MATPQEVSIDAGNKAKITVPKEQWLAFLLDKHKPRTYDVGTQRDPMIVILCTCDPELWRVAETFNYGQHLFGVLEEQYFDNLNLR